MELTSLRSKELRLGTAPIRAAAQFHVMHKMR